MTDQNRGQVGAERRRVRAGVVPGRVVPLAAAQTQRLYAGDWKHFSAWCRVNRQPSLPTTADALMAYMLAAAPGLGRGARGRRLAAIRAAHRQAGLPAPALDPAARAAIRRTPVPPNGRRTEMPGAAALTRLALRCTGDIAGLRDRAVLLLAAAAPLAQEVLLRLQREQIRFAEPDMVLLLDDEAHLRVSGAAERAGCPVHAMLDWLDASETRFGPVFRKVDRWGNVEHEALGPDGVRRIVARRTRLTRTKSPRAKPA